MPLSWHWPLSGPSRTPLSLEMPRRFGNRVNEEIYFPFVLSELPHLFANPAERWRNSPFPIFSIYLCPAPVWSNQIVDQAEDGTSLCTCQLRRGYLHRHGVATHCMNALDETMQCRLEESSKRNVLVPDVWPAIGMWDGRLACLGGQANPVQAVWLLIRELVVVRIPLPRTLSPFSRVTRLE